MNVYQRKLAVMADLGSIKPDATHPHHRFKYVSYQHLMDSLRPLCIKHGLDVTAEVHEGAAIITLTNVEEPTDRIVQQFGPVGLPDDKAGSYVVKYGLMKLMLIGDGEDPDAGDLKPRSGAATTASVPQSAPPPSASPAAAVEQSANGGSGADPRALLKKALLAMDATDRAAWLQERGFSKLTGHDIDAMPPSKVKALLEAAQ